MTAPVQLDWRGHRNAPSTVRLTPADWPSGLYFLRLTATDRRIGYAPFVVHPSVLGASARVAVVLSTNTWQAYNFRDSNGDGWGESWYVSNAVHSVDTEAGGGGVRWYELRIDRHRDVHLHQQGTYAPDRFYRWMASPAMDRLGNIGIGYSFGGAPNYAGQRLAAR